MKRIAIGNTGLKVNKNGFGALPIQRISVKEAVYLLRKAYDNGIDFYDTARFYTDSEEKIGEAFSGIRDKVVIASIMRAGLTLHNGVLEVFDKAENSFIAAYRKYGNDNKFVIQMEYTC